MTADSAHPAAPAASSASVWRRFIERLPPSLRPLDEERPSSRRRKVERAVLVALLLLIAVSATYDITRQVSINYRLTADIQTWRALTGQHFKNISIEQDEKHFTKHDVACANIFFAKPGAATQICFVMVGPVVHGERATHAGFFLAAHKPDHPKWRYGCFGTRMKHFACKLSMPKAFKRVPGDFYEEPEALASTGKAVAPSGRAAVERWLEIVKAERARSG